MPSASRSRLRVAINGWFWSRPDTGSGQYLRQLLDALVKADPDIELALVLPTETSDIPPAASLPNIHWVQKPVRQTNLAKLWWEQVIVPRTASAVGCSLLHVPYWAPPALCAVPVVVTVHDIIPRILPSYRGGPLVRLYTALVSATTGRAAAVLADSEASRNDIIHYLRVSPDLVHTAPLALPPHYTPQPGLDDERIRSNLGLSEPYALYLGGFDVRKNLRAVLSAFGFAQRVLPHIRLVVGGRLPESDTAFAPDPRRIAREIGLAEDAVQFVGFIPEELKPAVYRGARAFVFPSLYEGFGYPPLEALSCGVPVIASSASSLPEVVGEAGVLCEPDDDRGMAGALIRLFNDDAHYNALRRQALAQREVFSWDRTASQTLAAYRFAARNATDDPPARAPQ